MTVCRSFQTRWYGEVDDTHFPSAGNHFMEGDVTMAVIRSRSHQLGRQVQSNNYYWLASSLINQCLLSSCIDKPFHNLSCS